MLKGVTITIVLAVFPCLSGGSPRPQSGSADPVAISVWSFGATPNERGSNFRTPLQHAFEALQRRGGGTLLIPKGHYYLDFPDIASDIDPAAPISRPALQNGALTRSKLVLVPADTKIRGEKDANGQPATYIHWKSTGFPILSFVNADHSSLVDLAFIFDGTQPQFFPWSQEQFLSAVGLNACCLAGPYELSTVVYTISSSHLKFENLAFMSGQQPPDNEHTFAFGIVTKGTGPIAPATRQDISALRLNQSMPAGGLTDCVTGNTYQSLRFNGFVMGMVLSGQCEAIVDNIAGNERGSWFRSFAPSRETEPKIAFIGPPGHLIYFTAQPVFDITRSLSHAEGERRIHSVIRNRRVTIRNVKEGPSTLSNYNSLGTLALKNIEDGTVENIESSHPEGLLQTMADAHNVSLQNMTWTSQRNLCDEPDAQSNCNVPVIGLVPGANEPGMDGFSDHIVFKNITLRSPHWATIFQVSSPEKGPMSRAITVDGLLIECAPFLHKGQTGPKGIITTQAEDSTFSNVTYAPVVSAENSTEPVNYAASFWLPIMNTTLDMTIRQPHGLPPNSPVIHCDVARHDALNELTSSITKSAVTRHLQN
jgi:hypothetical protein